MKSFTSLLVFLAVFATTSFYVVSSLPLESNRDSLDAYEEDYDYGEQQDQANSDEDEDDDEEPNTAISKGGRIEVTEGSTAILPCATTNMNGPYLWIKGNLMIFTTNIPNGAAIGSKLSVDGNHSLVVPDANAAHDQDTYTCQFYNRKARMNITYQLQVHRKNRVQIDVVPDDSKSKSSSSPKNHHIELEADDRENMILDQQEIVSEPSSSAPLVISILNVLVPTAIVVTTSGHFLLK